MIRQNKGFTLIDMVVGIGVGGVVILIFLNVISFMRMSEAKYRLRADARVSRSLGERFLWMGLKNAAPSFNTLQVADDAGNPFFELNRDLPSMNPIPAARRRELTLSKSSLVKTMVALLTNTNVADANSGKPSMVYLDPSKLFPISNWVPGTAPALNWNAFKQLIVDANSNMLTIVGGRPVFLEVFIPSNFRSATQTVADAPNPSSFFLRYDGATFTTETFGGLYTPKNPVDPSITYTDLGAFIRQMPSASGGIPPLIVRVVRLVQYEIYPDPVRFRPKKNINDPTEIAVKYWHLRYKVWDGGSFVAPTMIADNIESISFVREDIGDPAIKINLVKEEPAI